MIIQHLIERFKQKSSRSQSTTVFKYISLAIFNLMVYITMLATPAYAVYVEPDDCGGDGQAPCYVSSAKYLGQVKVPKPQSDAFFDPREGGEWWTCGGWRRTIYAVTSSKACETGSWPFNLSWKRATFLSKTVNPKPEGAFTDPRLDDLSAGSQYWRCPPGFYRNLNPVTHSAACSANIGAECDSGNVNVPNFTGSGFTCYTKNECGGLGERPCVVWERIPSCNAGLIEDFFDNSCIDKEVGQCKTFARAAGLLENVSDISSNITDALERGKKMADAVLSNIPGYQQSKQFSEETGVTFATALFGSESSTQDTLSELNTLAQPFLTAYPEVQRLKNAVTDNKEALLRFLATTKNCELSKSERIAQILTILGYKIPADVDLQAAGDDTSWVTRVFDFIIPPTYADFGDHPIMMIGFSLSGSVILGATTGMFIAIDLDTGEVGLFWGIGPQIVISTAYFTKEFVDAGVSFVGGLAFLPSLDEVSGWGGSVGFGAQATGTSFYKNLTGGFDILLNDFANGIDPIGIGFNVGFASTKENGAADISFSYTHDWELLSVGRDYINIDLANRPGLEVSIADVAYGKTASMSSTHGNGNYPAGMAVNGMYKPSGDMAHNSNYVAGEWWQVDLGGVYSLTSSKWYNRTDCCADRMNNYLVQVSLDGVYWYTVSEQTTKMGYPTTISLAHAEARYVRLVQRNNAPINFAEVEIYGSPAVVSEVAQGKTASMSSVHTSFTADHAVDGIITGKEPDLAHTAIPQAGEWWMVDLGSEQHLTHSMWFNRTSCCSDRMNDYTIQVSSDKINWTTISQQTVKMGSPTLIFLNTYARYVRLLQNKNDYINFSEVKIYSLQ